MIKSSEHDQLYWAIPMGKLNHGVKVNYEKVQTVDGVKYPVLAKI